MKEIVKTNFGEVLWVTHYAPEGWRKRVDYYSINGREIAMSELFNRDKTTIIKLNYTSQEKIYYHRRIKRGNRHGFIYFVK